VFFYWLKDRATKFRTVPEKHLSGYKDSISNPPYVKVNGEEHRIRFLSVVEGIVGWAMPTKFQSCKVGKDNPEICPERSVGKAHPTNDVLPRITLLGKLSCDSAVANFP
jgi:hypothetical protein